MDAAEYIEELRSNYTILGELDFIFAKGALALSMNASRPIFNTDGYIHIREGRHPLLDKKKVVPITIMLGKEFDLLIVTGPNTGGKTVSLKTVGLFTLMGQAGLHIPALTAPSFLYSKMYTPISGMSRVLSRVSVHSLHT